MKPILHFLFLAFFCQKTIAQDGRTFNFDLKNPIDLKKINIVSAQNFDVVYINITDLTFVDAPFIAASIRLEGQRLDDNIVINVHAKDKAKNRVNYLNLHHFHESDADPSQVFVSELAYLDKSTSHVQFAIRMEKPALSKLNSIAVRLFNPTNIPPVKSEVLSPQGACDLPPSVSRSVWGANWGLQNNTIYKGSPTYAPVTHLIVHHSAGPNTSTNWAATVASIFDFHVTSNGWSDVGYNYLIAPDGTLFYGRGGGNNVIGAHYCAKNTNTMGVCMVGTYTSVAPTDTAWRTLERIFSWKAVESNINPMDSKTLSDLGSIPVINGHRSGCSTECPGDSNFNRLPALRSRLSAMVTACRAVSTKDLNELGEITLSPNPVLNGKLLLTAQLKSPQYISIKAFDALGKQVLAQTVAENATTVSTELDITFMPKGVYFFYIYSGKSFTTQKIIID
jgi:hypothetical protein